MNASAIQVVWFKRDLRLIDHSAIVAASMRGGPVLFLYAFEPSVMALPEFDERHGRFIYQSVQALQQGLQQKGHQLLIVHNEVLPALEQIHESIPIGTLYSHQETGQLITFERDRKVGAWCRSMGIEWKEYTQDGVIRALRSREGWTDRFRESMYAPMLEPEWPRLRPVQLPGQLLDKVRGNVLPQSFQQQPENMQPGGAPYAHRYLESFVQQRARLYSRHISKPEGSRRSCSRLSPYLAFGCLSARQVWQATDPNGAGNSHLSLQFKRFHSRMWWRSHYIQKLESDYRIEWEDINRGFEQLPRRQDEHLYTAWTEGQTGFPMIDASMRCLNATGYLNFRMRAMLATFWSFTLWQEWRIGARYLAKVFLDFEPGIHYPQWQMQAGTSGYHPLRIYNPTTQSVRHDPDGAFVRRWVPELSEVPAPLIYEPWKMTALDQTWTKCRIGVDYPLPVVEFERATRLAKETYWNFRQSDAVQRRLPEVWERLCLPENIAAYKKGSPGKAMS